MSGFVADYASATVHPSPNFGVRRSGMRPDAVILHYTGMDSAEAAECRLCDPAAEVSAHYLVHEDGRVVQMVAEAARAWHAGRASWQGLSDVNSFSIGIEIVNPGHAGGYPDFPESQIAAVIALCRDICRRHGIAAHRVLAHSDVAPGRKVDPGEKFPWHRLAREGVGHYVAPTPLRAGPSLAEGDEGEAVRTLQEMLARYGYGVETTGFFDSFTTTVVRAFQRHFRPARVDGIADVSTRDTLARLLAALPRGAASR
ncbi:N-acetylmuramoyl-L-alanine amidase [Chelativorans intermedius]|uniref:N-acetylmuramoyl-L-alanine amidase n=1 Tax=Chelativorans intermedius TaxID=515947 RepID=A0ABV6D834_9HYPH|nr:N-acetylmuramoyl-L-alanine amidase [Chelativorans intermedius]MCT8996865.1 N-acetylmuramoyl-L-alanine amidase [Chelativorans intermedius]